MSEELKPCPFCGSEAKVLTMEYGGCNYYGVFCIDDMDSKFQHGHCIDNFSSKQEAIDAWNSRADARTRGSWLRYDDDESNTWECSVCHDVWQLEDGTPAENDMKYCFHCGALMEEVAGHE